MTESAVTIAGNGGNAAYWRIIFDYPPSTLQTGRCSKLCKTCSHA